MARRLYAPLIRSPLTLVEHFQLLGIFVAVQPHPDWGRAGARFRRHAVVRQRAGPRCDRQPLLGYRVVAMLRPPPVRWLFSIAIQTTFGCEVGWTGNSIGASGSSPVHFNIGTISSRPSGDPDTRRDRRRRIEGRYSVVVGEFQRPRRSLIIQPAATSSMPHGVRPG